MLETGVRSLGREDPLEKEMATQSSILGESHGQRGLAGYSLWGHKNWTRLWWTHHHGVSHAPLSSPPRAHPVSTGSLSTSVCTSIPAGALLMTDTVCRAAPRTYPRIRWNQFLPSVGTGVGTQGAGRRLPSGRTGSSSPCLPTPASSSFKNHRSPSQALGTR